MKINYIQVPSDLTISKRITTKTPFSIDIATLKKPILSIDKISIYHLLLIIDMTFPPLSFWFIESSFFFYPASHRYILVNILHDHTSGITVRMVPHASDTARDRRRSIVPRERGREKSSDILWRSRDWRVYRADTAFLHSLFARPKEDEHGELLKLPRSEMTVQDPSVLPLRDSHIFASRSYLIARFIPP